MSKYDNIPGELNTEAQRRVNAHDQHGNFQGTPAGGRLEPTPGARMGCEAIRATLPELTGEAEEAARRQLDAREE